MAFTFESSKFKRLNDPRYVKTLVRLNEYKDGEYVSDKLLDYHECTDDDMKEFYPIQESSKSVFKNIHESDDRGFYCIDWTEELVINGDFTGDH